MVTVALSTLGTLVVIMVVLNFRKPEKEPHHRVKRFYDVKSPQLKREMGALLGPTIVPGNTVQALENGDKIFPSMLDAIGAAKRTITFETHIYWSGTVGGQFDRRIRVSPLTRYSAVFMSDAAPQHCIVGRRLLARREHLQKFQCTVPHGVLFETSYIVANDEQGG